MKKSVFKEGYDYKSLEEVQNHVKKHGHSPNIPSTQAIGENGIQLGKMNIKLFEKTDGLMLYDLQQHKKPQEKDHIIRRDDLRDGGYKIRNGETRKGVSKNLDIF